MIPNQYLFEDYGKVVFSLFDIFSGYFIYKILLNSRIKPKDAKKYSALWILNPIVIVLSTRGSSDSIVCFLVFCTMYLLQNNNWFLAGIVFGISIHFKLYPIIYSLLFFLNCCSGASGSRRKGIFFASTTLLVFVLLTLFFYCCYGYEFIYETLLYHAIRVDIRHNYSHLFYLLYLVSSNNANPGSWVWIPHLILFPLISYKYRHDIPYGVFLLSFLFVMYNKVVTAQYFLWWLAPLILILPNCSLSVLQWIGLLCLFVGAQNVWNAVAYRLEFMGDNLFIWVWLACMFFFVGQMIIVFTIMTHYHGVYPIRIKGE